MRVVHWYPNFLGGGATANAALGLANAEANLGAEVSIAAADTLNPPLYGSIREKISPGVRLIHWKPTWVVRRGSFVIRGLPSNVRQSLTSWQPHVVHIHGEFNPDNLSVPVLFKCPIVLSPHGAFAPEVFTKNRRVLKGIYFQLARQLLYRHVKAFHALSPMEDAHISDLLPGVRVYCVPEGPSFQAERSLSPDTKQNSFEAVRFLFIGRLDVFTKGLDTLLDAFAEAERRLADRVTVLTLVGPDWNGGMERLRRRAQELGIAERVVFLGCLSPEEVNAMLHKSDIYIQLSRHDGFPLSVAEALSAAKPAILSENIGTVSWPELANLPQVRIVSLKGRETVEAMVDFVRRLGVVKSAAEQCHNIVHDFLSWDRVANLHLNAYRTVCAPC
jgi:glycosyltransferase involved in cell wall biosynthesis